MKEDCFHLGVKGLIHNEEGKLLLLKLNPLKTKRDCWDIPGGRIQKNESLSDALKREIFEETGLQNIVRITSFTMALSGIRIPIAGGDVGLIFATYLCDVIDPFPIQLSDEHVEFGWFTPQQAAELLHAYPHEFKEKLTALQLFERVVS